MALVPSMSGKTKTAVVAALLFYIIANPMTYRLVDTVLGWVAGRIAGPSGCPTNWGVVVHALVFGAVAYYVL